jgi:hypothetical protein
MADLFLIREVRAYLIAQGVVQAAETASTGDYSPPRCWLDPRDGAPEPKVASGEDAVVTITSTLTIPGEWLEGRYLEQRIVEITTRAGSSERAELVQRQIRNVLEEQVNTFFGDLRIESSKLWRGDQKISSDATSYTRSQSFVIAARVKSLAGLPYAS